MQHHEDTFTGVGGIPIYWQSWRVEDPRATVVIAHGAGEHSGRYGYVVEALNERGFDVYGIDHRGHGKSGGKRAVIDRFDNAVADLDTLIDLCAKPVYLLGHSLGGCLSVKYALAHQDKLAGLCLSGPVLLLEGAPPLMLAVSKLLSSVLPSLPVFGVGPEAISRDPAEVERYATDPLVLHGKVPVRTVAEIAAAVGSFPARFSSLTLPILLQHGTADVLSPPAGSQLAHDNVSSTDKTLHLYDGLFHEIFNELPEDRATVLNDLATWLEKHTA